MKVSIVVEFQGNSCEVDGFEILGVYSSEKLANQERAKLPANSKWKWYQVQEFEVDSPVTKCYVAEGLTTEN